MPAATTTDVSHRRPVARGASLLLGLLLLAGAAPAAAGQGMLLELRPRVGDTLRLQLDQDLEVVATQKVRGVDSTVTMSRRVTVYSRSVAQKVDARGATVVAITDSMVVREAGGRTTRAGLGGARASLHVAPDGTTRVLDQGGLMTPETAALVSQMPATLPRQRVAPGAAWSDTSKVPIPGQPDGAAAGRLTATFRLDSLSRYGDMAHVSMRGTLERPKGVTRGGMRYESAGTVAGAFQVDRRRGWFTSVHAVVATRSSVSREGGSAEPVHVRTRVTQWLRVLDAVDKD